MEFSDVYDASRMKTGKIIARGEKDAEDEYEMIVNVCIFNSKNEMLIQKRHSSKTQWSNMWDFTVGGGVMAGETSQSGGERECMEEIGCEIDLSGVRPHLTVAIGRGFEDIFLIERNLDIETLKLQREEVQAVKWATEQEILSMADSGEFMAYYKELISLLFRMRHKYGNQSR
jgi:Isopentenyldiphosphate isomerase